MSSRDSSAASYVILGLLETYGFETIYEMKQFIEVSIGFFWPFPHSQLYSETRRLEKEGLITVEAEETGRRRKVLQITDAGRTVLRDWQTESVDVTTEIRDLGLLKLFLSRPTDGEDLAALASRQVELHREMLGVYRRLADEYQSTRSPGEKTLELGLAYEQVAIDFWQSVIDDYSPEH